MQETIQPVAEAKQRARKYWEMDGIPSLVLGLILFLIGTQDRIDDWFAAKLPSASLLLGLSLVFSCFWLFVKQDKIIDWAKARVTYPRTGYVARPGSASKNNPVSPVSPTFAVLGVLVIILIALAGVISGWKGWRAGDGILFLHPALNVWIGAFCGLLPLLFVLVFGLKHKRRWSRREWILGLGAPVAWAAGWLLSKSGSRSNSALAVSGAWFFAVGAYRLIFYLRRNPVNRA